MQPPIKVAACQVPDIREDIPASLACIADFTRRAGATGARLVCFPECFLQGYLTTEQPARRHALNLTSPAFATILHQLAPLKPMLVLGLIESDHNTLFNTAVVIQSGQLIGSYRKQNLLPGERLFHPGHTTPIFQVDSLRFGINICADTQTPEAAAAVAARGAKLILCPANNMMRKQTAELWKNRHHESRTQRAKETALWLISADVTGARENSLALGPTSIINPQGQILSQVPTLQTGIVMAEVPT